MTKAEEILQFYDSLSLKDEQLPTEVKVMNPYSEASPEIKAVIGEFYHKFYNDKNPRGLILGINPGRLGAGVTGIPFTDSHRLKENCDIDFPGETRETSAAFVYDVIEAFGGATSFYKRWFIGAVSPLGFIHKNNKGNWVNYNYYDDKKLELATRSYIVKNLKLQKKICGGPESCVILGTGKNYKYLKKLNEDKKIFKEIIPLAHPRYIMQYKLKKKDDYIREFLEVLK